MGWFIYFIYKYVTTSIKKKLGEMNTVLIALIDRVRMLDNDIIRLRSKVNTVLELREKQKKKSSSNKSFLINTNMITLQFNKIVLVSFLLCISLTNTSTASELTHKFGNPAFSKEGYSQHALSIEQLQYTRENDSYKR